MFLSITDYAAAERSFREAIAVARRQGAKLGALLAPTCLARLWCDQGKRTEARDLLAPIYGWFTEGFNNTDLKEARRFATVMREVAHRYRRNPARLAKC